MDEERFIVEVEKHSILYDTSHPFSKDNSQMEATWKQIADTIVVEGEYYYCEISWFSRTWM